MSLLALPENHLFLTAENDMREICSNSLVPMGITYFNYLRVYNDGSCYLLCTHSNLIQYVFENNISVAAPIAENLIKKNFNYFILPIGSYNKFVHHAKVNLNLANFIDLVDLYDDYIELFCFGASPNNSEIVNFYLGNMNFLDKFKLYFKNKAFNLLNKGERNKVILPTEMLPPYQGLSYKRVSNYEANLIKNTNQKHYNLIYKSENIKLTPRQYDCLLQLASGCTAKEAAYNLGISHRTVENYLANLKSVLNCHKKSQLISIFLNAVRKAGIDMASLVS